MARADDSDEERHDRFRSERNSSSLKPSSTLGYSKRSHHPLRESSRDRNNRSRSRRSIDRSRRSYEESESSRKRHDYKEGECDRRREHRSKRSSSPDRSKRKHRSKERSSIEKRSEKFSSHDSKMGQMRNSKHYRKSKERENHTSLPQVDTFVQKFERRRDSSVDEEIIDNIETYRDSSPSPDRSKRKKKKNSEKEKRKDKRKEKKKKKKKADCDEEAIPNLDSPACTKTNESDAIVVIADEHSKKSDVKECQKSEGDVYGPKVPPIKSESTLIKPVVPSSSPEHSLPGNRPADLGSQPKKGTTFFGSVAPPITERHSGGEDEEEDTVLDYGQDTLLPAATTKEKGETFTSEVECDRVYGPALPQRIKVADTVEDDASYGPALPPHLLDFKEPLEIDDRDDEPCYGPQPAGTGGRTQEELEIRAALIKRQLENKGYENLTKRRDEWMTELPENRRAEFGLGPRKFRSRAAPDLSDRSCWTDTPVDKNKKDELTKLGLEGTDDDEDMSRRLRIAERDKEMEKKTRKVKKHENSLLEIHQKELKKKKKKEEKKHGGKQERRPFNREIDLQSNRFDEAQKKSIIKKAQLLDGRFSSGESKYL